MQEINENNAFVAPRNPVGETFNYSMKYTAAAKAAGYKWKGNWYTPHPNRRTRRMAARLEGTSKKGK